VALHTYVIKRRTAMTVVSKLRATCYGSTPIEPEYTQDLGDVTFSKL
jgi:hypothetical protein